VRSVSLFDCTYQYITTEWVKKACSTRSFFREKYSKQNNVLPEKELHEIGASLEHSPCKSLTQLAQEAGFNDNRVVNN
jgi:hypothetical protein